ncbi:50S ribosomal protein L10 [mine drainage metagenome]|uniref:50S ribosomal protein L10 n=1 Tax=mine drainage metagenome TaxID=410659 RepID=A0A1J5Q703_9ZZZZ
MRRGVSYLRRKEKMARPDKAAAVAEMTEDFRNAQATVLTEYRGLTVAAMKQLRRNLGTENKYSVVKNTLTKIAAREAGIAVPDELLVGPSAVAFINGDPVVAAKSLKDFAKTNPLLVIKGGVLDGKFLDAAAMNKLADLESREVLLSKMAGAIKAAFAQAIRSIDALRIKMEEETAPAAAPVVEEVTPTTVEAVEEAPVAEAVAEVSEAVEEVPTEESKG